MIKVEGEEVRMSKNEFDKILIFWDKSLTLTSDTVGCKPEIKDEMMREVTKYYRKLQRLIKGK